MHVAVVMMSMSARGLIPLSLRQEAVAKLVDEQQLSRVGGGGSGEASAGGGRGSGDAAGGGGSGGVPTNTNALASDGLAGSRSSGAGGVVAKTAHKSQLSLIAGSIKTKRKRWGEERMNGGFVL